MRSGIIADLHGMLAMVSRKTDVYKKPNPTGYTYPVRIRRLLTASEGGRRHVPGIERNHERRLGSR